MADDRHVLRPVAGPEGCEVFAEDHVQHPVQAVLHPPVRSHDTGEAQSTERDRTQIIACLVLDLSVSLDLGFDPPDHGEHTGDPGVTSRYAVVLAPYRGDHSPIKSARLIVNDPESGALGIAVELEGRTDYILSSLDDRARRYGPITMAGRFGFASVGADGKLQRAYLLNGTSSATAPRR